MDFITVIICVYNSEKYLEKTLSSLEKQDYPNINWLIIDDCSTDNSPNIINEFKNKHQSNTTVYRMEKNSGTARVRNFALEKANTELVMFFDSDDIAKENLVSESYKAIKNDENCIAVSCFSSYISENGKKLPGGMFFKIENQEEFLNKTKNKKLIFLSPTTLFYKKYALQVGGYRVNGFPKGNIRYEDLSEDLDLWNRLADLYVNEKYIITLPKVLYFYRKRSNSISAPKENQFAMFLKIKFIKQNLKNRRNGLPEIDFTDFLSKITKKEYKKLNRHFNSEFYYRKAAFSFANKKYFSIPFFVLISIVLNPKYIIQKFNSNILRRNHGIFK
ncbi:MAG: glycosyltransferase family 2 protein [Clostridia bacterium]|nr:glycosyltransferase family 2 protein [Clostridia bacterium]